MLPVETHTAALEALRAKKVDFLLTGPAEYVVIHKQTKARIVVGLLRSDYFATIVTLADSPYRSVQSLKGTKIVVIACEYSATCTKADTAIVVRPGTTPALALGLAAVIMREKLYDADYVKRWTDLPVLVRMDTLQYLKAADVFGGRAPRERARLHGRRDGGQGRRRATDQSAGHHGQRPCGAIDVREIRVVTALSTVVNTGKRTASATRDRARAMLNCASAITPSTSAKAP